MSSLIIIMDIEYDMHELRNQNTVMRSLEVYFHHFGTVASPTSSFIHIGYNTPKNTFSLVVGAKNEEGKSISLQPYEMRINCYRLLVKMNTHRSALHEFTLMRLLCVRFVCCVAHTLFARTRRQTFHISPEANV